MKEFGIRLRESRERLGMSQAQIAKELGISQSSVSQHEKGAATPSFKIIIRYADYYDVTMDYLLARTDDPHGIVGTPFF